jgi:transcriptional regulator with XRE-family HTH domain
MCLKLYFVIILFDSTFNANFMKTLSDLGDELQRLRQSAKRNQTHLAEATGMRQEALSRFERGRGNDFSVAKLLRLAQALGYDLAFVPSHGRPTLDDVLAETRASANTGPESR